jgi:hypothetical protein
MKNNQGRIENVINDTLFPQTKHVDGVKQVLEFMEDVSQSLSEEQIRALILLQELGNNKRLHKKNPYEGLIKAIEGKYKIAAADTSVYLDTIQELVPKPPRPIIFKDKEEGKK